MAKFWPDGAIETIEELATLLVQPGKELHRVEQGGYIVGMLTPGKNTIFLSGDIVFFKVLQHGYKKELYEAEYSCLDSNIGRLNNYNRHMLFTDFDLASRYALQLQNDKEYQQEIAEHLAIYVEIWGSSWEDEE